MIGPPATQLLSAERFRELIATAPPLDDDFVADVRAARAAIAALGDPWPS